MHIMFDLAGTVLGALDMSLRPGIKETISALRERGVKVNFWTNGPVDYYKHILKEVGLDGDIYSKAKELPFKPDICVDDEPNERMPGRIYKVKMHASDVMPGERILTAELLCLDGQQFFWD
ncbi:MAG: HAD family hydrolase [Deltaproteobacteria bacterium]|nr:HAD family hydrolase [Deltaproteobacteria bacterium]